MPKLRTFLFSVLLLFAASGTAQVQGNRVFVFPSGVSPNVTVLDAATLANLGTVVASPNAFLALGTPTGSKYYILSNNSFHTLTIVNSSNLGAPVYQNLDANASAAALTPDGRKLLVAAGTLKIFDTATDQKIGDVGVGGGPTEIEVANDSGRAFVMSTSAGLISIVDLTVSPPAVTNQVSVSTPLSMALRPDNKSLLVLVPNGMRQVNLKTGNISDPIPVNNVSIGKVLATPDSARAVVVNRGSPPLNVSQVVDLTGVNPPLQIGPANQTLDRVAIVDNSTAFGIVVGSPNSVVKIDLATGSTTPQTYGQNARSLEVSPNGKAVYVAVLSGATGSVARVDVALNSAITQSLGVPPTGVSAVFPPPTTGAVSMSINGGDRQNVIAGQSADVPLSVKVVTADGSPAFNVPVTFATAASGVTFSPAQPSRTNSRGIAQAVVTVAAATSLRGEPPEQTATLDSAASPAPVEQGIQTIAITATAPGAGGVNFSLTVGSGTGLILIDGNYQVTRPNQPFPLPLIVRVTGLDGFPVPAGTEVFFSGQNVLPPSVTAKTDPDGFATAQFSGFIPQGIAVSVASNVNVGVNGRGELGTVSFFLQTALSLPNFSDTIFGDMQQGGAGQTLSVPLTVQLINSFGPVGFIGVYWKVIEGPAGEGSAILDPRISTTDGAGFARTNVTLGPVGSTQPIRIRATVPGVSGGVTFSVFATGGPPAEVRILQGDGCPGATPTACNQPGAPGSTLPIALRVQVLDLLGKPVPLPNAQYPLLFNVDPPEAAQIQNFFQQSDGQASVLVKLGNTPGPFKVIATSGNGIATFNLRITSNAAAVVVLSGNNQRVNAGDTTGPITLRVNDSLGNASPGVPLTITAPATVTLVPAQGAPGNPLTLTGGADGRVTFSARVGSTSALGPFSITASFNVDGRSGSVTVAVTVGGRTPVFASASVVNAGSFSPGLTPYGLGSVFGTGFSSVTGLEFPGGALSHKGTILRIDGQAMPLYLVSNQDGQEQINFHARSDLVAGTTVTVEIENNGSRSSVQVFVLRVQPGIFEYTPQGSNLKYAAALKTDGTVVGPNNPVPRGGFFSAFFTGGGITLPILQAGQPGPASPLATTFIEAVAGIADQGAAVSFSGVAPGLVIYQINVQVPIDAPIGPNVKFSIIMQGAPSQDSRIAVGPAQ